MPSVARPQPVLADAAIASRRSKAHSLPSVRGTHPRYDLPAFRQSSKAVAISLENRAIRYYTDAAEKIHSTFDRHIDPVVPDLGDTDNRPVFSRCA